MRLTPRGGREAIDGWAVDADGRPYLKVRVSAPPVEGEANAALVALLAKRLSLPRSAVRVASGATARLKRIEVEGLAQDALDRLLNRPPNWPA